MVTKVWRALDDGILVPLQVGNNVDDWCQRMFRDGTYVDLTFLKMSASVLDSDIAVVSLHGNASSSCHVIRAGLLDGRHGQARSGKNFPIFVGYFKDEKHKSGHFQSITPYRDSEILDMVKSIKGQRRLSCSATSKPPYRDSPDDDLVGDVTPGPAYIDIMAMFDEKMFSLGMIRSRTKLDTPINGNCGPEGV